MTIYKNIEELIENEAHKQVLIVTVRYARSSF